MPFSLRFVLCVFACTVASLAAPAPTAIYHTTDALLSALRTTASSCPHASARWASVIPSTSSSRSSLHPQAARVLVITFSLNLSSTPTATLRTRPAILASFGEHARERITSELALFTLRRLCAHPPAVLAHAQLVILPLVNAAGRRLAETGEPCRRANAAGVDLNRNFAVRWGLTDKDTRHEEEPPGPHPLSEPESRALDAVAAAVAPAVYVAVHSGGTAVLTPWDHGDAPVHAIVKDVARKLARWHCGGCYAGNALQTFGYRAYGTAADHVHAVIGVPFVYTLEVYGDGSANDNECERMFNPIRSKDFDLVMSNWSQVLATIAGEVLRLPRRSWPKPAISLKREEATKWRSGYRVVLAGDGQEIRMKRLQQIRVVWAYAVLVALATGALLGRGRRKARKSLAGKRAKGTPNVRSGSGRNGLGSSGACW